MNLDIDFEYLKPAAGKRWAGTIFIPVDTPDIDQLIDHLRLSLKKDGATQDRHFDYALVRYCLWGVKYHVFNTYTWIDYKLTIKVLKRDFPEVKFMVMASGDFV
ncbi:hypothetical protein Bbelb_370310 [Branchiostoma belcheri]|nr:hypothetical protein Bbelb_370310 [Branchiostoma belcheri]